MNYLLLRRFAFLFFLSIICLLSYYWYCINTTLKIDQQETTLDIAYGDNIIRIAQRLYKDGLLAHPNQLVLATYLSGNASKIKAGEYLLQDKMTIKQLMQKMTIGDVIKRQVTFLEGWTFKQILAELKRYPNIKTTIEEGSLDNVWNEIGLAPAMSPEGQFFPDSYQYEKGVTDISILRRSHDLMEVTLQNEWQTRAANLPYKNAYEALIMASIIEKETGVASERDRIAAVFINRLKLNMPLQTDPTVIYGLGERYTGNLTKAHLQQDTPYNTYTRVGLPVTPIANPGKEAIHAALHPASGNVLYFVAKGDGTHYFSETLTEHNKAVRQYQVDQKSKTYHSVPVR